MSSGLSDASLAFIVAIPALLVPLLIPADTLAGASWRSTGIRNLHDVRRVHKGNTELGPLYTPSEQVLETSDIVTLDSLLTPETQNMIAMLKFRMKRKPLIINTSRGWLVDEAELERALEEGLLQQGRNRRDAARATPGGRSTDADGKTLERDRDAACAWVSDEAQQTLPDQLIDVSRISWWERRPISSRAPIEVS